MVTEISQKVAKKFYCEICDYKCSNKFDYNKHLSTRKHEKLAICDTFVTNGDTKSAKIAEQSDFTCKNCEKIYKSRNGLWNHQKKCLVVPESKKKQPESEILCKLIEQNMELVTQNQEFKQMMVEQNKQNAELQKQLLDLAKETKITTINNNTNNNKFNMNFFLNEKCKDALNIMDFVSSLQLQLQDLEETGRLGYIQGISRIFINGLKELDIHKRPIHCSDSKRETMYVKDEDLWEKDEAKRKISKMLTHVAHKNQKQIPSWKEENPEYKDSESVKSEKYLKIIGESMSGLTNDDESSGYANQIIKNIAKEVIIKKEE